MSNKLMESVNICTDIGYHKSFNFLRIANESSNKYVEAITSADSTERATRRDLYNLYETGIALWSSSLNRTIRPS